MSALVSDVPIVFREVGILAGETTILDGISITISAGQPTVLIGPNGSGKTTLLRAAMGLTPASHGRITWGGREASPPTRRAIVFQRPVMLRRSAAGNVLYALAAAGCRAPNGNNGSPGCCLWSDWRASKGVRRDGCRAANSSASQWRVRWRETPRCFFSMSPLRASIPPPPKRSRTSCGPSARAA